MLLKIFFFNKLDENFLHAGVARLIDDDRFAGLVDIVVHAKVSCYSM